MVSTRFESTLFKPWKPVAKPVTRPVVAVSRAPPTVPKLDGKTLVYVYDNPKDAAAQQAMLACGESSLPPNAQVIVTGVPDCSFIPEENEIELLDVEDTSTMNKLRNRAKKAGKGYKLLADVTNCNLKGSSRGGRMFLRQKLRMDNYTSLPRSGMIREDVEDENQELDEEVRSSSRIQRNTSPAAVKYHPSPLYQKSSSKKWKKENDRILPSLRSPPPEWRAKVDSDYSLYYNETLPNQRWNTIGKSRKPYFSRSESAPLPTENTEDDTSAVVENRQKSESVIGLSSEVKPSTPKLVVSFDARKHLRAPHRQQGVRARRGIFTTTPHIQYDFNARAVGWSKAYARQY